MPRLLIDVNSIVHGMVTGRISGIGRTTMELVNALGNETDLPFDICLYSQNMKGIGVKNIFTEFDKLHFYIPNRPTVNKAMSFLPIIEKISKADLIHVPHNFEYVHDPEKVVLTLHDAMFMKILEKQFAHEQMRKEVPEFVRNVRGIITCSESSKKDITEMMGVDESKVKVIPWGYNKEIFRVQEDLEKSEKYLFKKFNLTNPFFFSVSCNAERKNTDKLVKSYLNFLNKNPINDLVLVWPDAPLWLREEVNSFRKGERIHFLDNISDEELAMFLNISSGLFFISDYEGFGLPILEALACGCPVVTLNNSSLPEVGGEAVFYLENTDLDSLENAFQIFDNDKELKANNFQKALRQASKFDWAKYAKEYVSYCNQLML